MKKIPLSPPPCKRNLRRLALSTAVVLAASCGGTSKPPATSNDATNEPAASTEPAPEPKADESPRADKGDTHEASASEGTADDRKAVLQLVIDDEELGKYLRVTEPGRFPLKVSGSDIPSGLTKATKPIDIVDAPGPKAAVLVITSVDVGDKRASVSYHYDVEGIKGTTTLEKGPRGWEILRSRIVEHFRPDSK